MSISRPNILLIIADQLRADHLGCYGNDIIRTPHIDSLSRRGVTFDRFYVASPICMPNRATLMTGRMPTLHGVRSNGIPLLQRNVTFAELLRAHGYRTGLIGKSHLQNILDASPVVNRSVWSGHAASPGLGEAVRDVVTGSEYEQEIESRWNNPAHRVQTPYYGFDHVEICDGHGDEAYGDYSHWLEARCPQAAALRGPANALPDDRYVCPQAWRTRLPEELYPTTYLADRTIEYLWACAAADDGAPFFLQCSFTDPHHPFTPPGRYWDMYDPDHIKAPATCKAPAPDAPPHLQWLHAERAAGKTNLNTPRAIAINEREAREATALSYGMLTMIDDAVGRIFQTLESCGLADNTLIVFTSDHGDLMGDHGLLFKHPLHYQGLVRVPFIWAEPPLSAPRPKRCAQLFGTLDIAQTLLDRTSIAPFNGIQGRSLLPCLRDDMSGHGHDAILIEEDGQRIWGGFDRPVRCRTLVNERWRLTIYLGADWGELYDLRNDPEEARNLWFLPDYRAIRADLVEILAFKMIDAQERSPLPTRLA